jgi:hypothetical protein
MFLSSLMSGFLVNDVINLKLNMTKKWPQY